MPSLSSTWQDIILYHSYLSMFIALFYSYLFITQQKFSLVPNNLLEESLNSHTPVDSCSFLDRKKNLYRAGFQSFETKKCCQNEYAII